MRHAVDRILVEWGERAHSEYPGPVGEAMAYSLATPGKRLRPVLVLGIYRELGGRGDGAELAAAVEVVHTYSLVHDDLPCMDDDDLRRGRPTTHRRFGVAAATEAGFRMVPLSARILASGARRLELSPEVVGAIGGELYAAAGAGGMVGGQLMDLTAEGQPVTIEELQAIHRAKTGALITASAVIGAVAAGAGEAQLRAVRAFGGALGLAFQIMDDVLDATATSGELGKTAGKDREQRKASFATLLGPERARAEAEVHVRRAVDRLGAGGIDSPLLASLARFIVDRRS